MKIISQHDGLNDEGKFIQYHHIFEILWNDTFRVVWSLQLNTPTGRVFESATLIIQSIVLTNNPHHLIHRVD